MRWIDHQDTASAELQVKGKDGDWHTCREFYDYSNFEAQMQRMLTDALREEIKILRVANSCFEAWNLTSPMPGQVERDSGGGGGGGGMNNDNNNNR